MIQLNFGGDVIFKYFLIFGLFFFSLTSIVPFTYADEITYTDEITYLPRENNNEKNIVEYINIKSSDYKVIDAIYSKTQQRALAVVIFKNSINIADCSINKPTVNPDKVTLEDLYSCQIEKGRGVLQIDSIQNKWVLLDTHINEYLNKNFIIKKTKEIGAPLFKGVFDMGLILPLIHLHFGLLKKVRGNFLVTSAAILENLIVIGYLSVSSLKDLTSVFHVVDMPIPSVEEYFDKRYEHLLNEKGDIGQVEVTEDFFGQSLDIIKASFYNAFDEINKNNSLWKTLN